MDILYHLGAVILVITVLYAVFRIVSAGYLNRYKIAIAFIGLFLSVVAYYTGITLKEFDEEQRLRTISAAEAVSAGFRYFAMDELSVLGGKEPEDFKTEELRDRTEWIGPYLQEVCRANGKEMGMYAQIYAFDKGGEAYLIADSYNEYILGTLYTDLSIAADDNPDSSHIMGYTVEKEVDGIYGFVHSPIYDNENNMVGFLEMGSEYGKLRNDRIRRVIGSAMQLVSFVVFAVMLLDVIRKYSRELREYTAIRKSQPREAKYCLSNTYDFLVTGLVYMDGMMMVMAVSSISANSDIDMALLFAIPFTAYRIGSWLGSVITSMLLGRFGERRMGVASAIISAASFAGMVFSIHRGNIYFFAVCKFLEGIFLESVLYALAEGIPYEIEDMDRRNKKISESQSAPEAATLITALSVCGIAIMLLILNTNVVFATIVLFIVCVMIRVVEVHRISWLIGLTENDGVEGKDVLENYFALEDGFKVLHGPVLGPLFTVSSSVAAGFLGFLCLVSPRVYGMIAEKMKTNNSNEED